ncbi:anthocyanidin 5 [Quercus suber]|uniref:Anthocyanidin 5 n=1 Tax=Quercus suber TaxID=58331 RepID=A0AAW0L9B4_QUESU
MLIDSPSISPIPASDMPGATHMAKLNGILLNMFDSLETKAIKAMSDGLCVPDGVGEVRERVLGFSDEAMVVQKEGGSSYVALAKLAQLWKQT